MIPGVHGWISPKPTLTVPTTGNAPIRRSAASGTSRATLTGCLLLGAWLALVVFTSSRHEFWRDEVRALTLARAAASPLQLYDVLQDDGHPILWYLLLYLGTSVVDSPAVLPIVSILVAFASVALFMFFAPLPLWFRCAFIFSAFPIFEYSVMARNYGISMLLLFLAARLYPMRTAHPYRLAVTLALLANTNVHSAILTCLFAFAWAWDIAAGQRKWLVPSEYSRYLPLGVLAVGVVLSLLVAMPRQGSILAPVEGGFTTTTSALRDAVLRPDLTFPDLLPSWLRPKLAVLLLYGAILGLVMRPNLFLAALGAQTAFGVFFRMVYPGWYRHQGLYLVFLVFLYWVFVESANLRAWSGARRWVCRGGFHVSVLALVLVQLTSAPRMVWADITGARSASAEFGEYLRTSPEYRDAVIVAEPDFAMEALRYYATNDIYLPREERFGRTVSWRGASKRHLTLGDVLRAAQQARQQSRKPVLIALAPVDLDVSGEQRYLYGTTFSWTAADVQEFRRATTPVRDFHAAEGDEHYRVFVLNAP
jgi:hypothetical protein